MGLGLRRLPPVFTQVLSSRNTTDRGSRVSSQSRPGCAVSRQATVRVSGALAPSCE